MCESFHSQRSIILQTRINVGAMVTADQINPAFPYHAQPWWYGASTLARTGKPQTSRVPSQERDEPSETVDALNSSTTHSPVALAPSAMCITCSCNNATMCLLLLFSHSTPQKSNSTNACTFKALEWQSRRTYQLSFKVIKPITNIFILFHPYT